MSVKGPPLPPLQPLLGPISQRRDEGLDQGILLQQITGETEQERIKAMRHGCRDEETDKRIPLKNQEPHSRQRLRAVAHISRFVAASAVPPVLMLFRP